MTAHFSKGEAPDRALGLDGVKRAKLKDQSYLALRQALLSGRFAPGAQVTVKDLAERLDAGVMPVREAVQRLIAEGALNALPTGRISVPKLTRAEFEEIVEVRLLLEPLAAEKAARCGGERLHGELLQWEEQLEAALRADNLEEAVTANASFHFCVYRHAGAALLAAHIESLWLRTGPMIIYLFRADGPQRFFAKMRSGSHRDLCTAVGEGDAASAYKAMARTIEVASSWYRAAYPFKSDI